MPTATLATNRRRNSPEGVLAAPPAVVPGPEYRSYEDGEYVIYEDVPVWCEHYSRLVDQHFGGDELAKVAERCNERITETGDYSPIVLRHTKEDGANDPPVVGLAGPFKVGTIGKSKPKAAILARMRFFKSDIDQVKRYPRVSVEYWFKKSDPTNGYFDPISLLGAETPELDLGLRYSKRTEDGEKCIRYRRTINLGDDSGDACTDNGDDTARADYAATAAPGGANTFVPNMSGDDDGKKKRKPGDGGAMDSVDYDRNGNDSNSGQAGGPLSAAAIAQLVEAMRPVMKEIVMEMVPTPPPPPSPEETAEPFSADASAAEGSDGAGDDVAGAGLNPPGSAPAGDGSDVAGKSSNEPGGQDGSSGREAAAGDGSKSKSFNPKKAEAEDMANSTDKSKAKYSADLNGEFTKIVSETPANLKAADGVVARYEKLAKQSIELIDSIGAKLDTAATERDEYRAKYEKATREATDKGAALTELSARVESIEADRRHSARYAKLQDLVHQDGYMIDIEDELKDFASADDAAFDRHVERIKSKYQRVPLRGLPVAPGRFEGKRPENEANESDREKFSKQAAEDVFQARQRGDKSVTYESALKAVYQKANKAIPVGA